MYRMSWKPEDYIAMVLTLTVFMFLILWTAMRLIVGDNAEPKNLELWTTLIGSIITGVFMYINRDKKG